MKKLKFFTLALVTASVSLTGCFATSAPDFSEYEAGDARKTAFFNFFVPIIEEENKTIAATRTQLLQWNTDKETIGWWDARKIRRLAADYKIDDFDINDKNHWVRLLRRIDTIPTSLVLAQAAKESGWGTSRFAVEGNNFFGLWCFSKGCGIVPSNRASDKSHEVATFDSTEASVKAYIHNLNTHRAYKTLRNIRAKLRASNEPITGVALTAGLGQYSERGDIYSKEIRSIISYNKLAQYNSNIED